MTPHRRLTGSSAALLLLLASLAGCSGLRVDRIIAVRPGDWTTAGGSNARLALSLQAPRPPLHQEWELDMAAGFGSGSPLVVDSMVLMGTLHGDLYGVQLRTGKKLGSVRLGDAVPGSPVFDGNVLVIPLGGTGESVVAYNLNEGRQVWRKTYGNVEMSLLVRGAYVYLGTAEGAVCCLDRVTGEQIWRYDIPRNTAFKGFRGSPAASDSLVYFGGEDGSLYAFGLSSGTLVWRTAAGGEIAGGVALVESTVVAGTTAGTLVGWDARRGFRRWTYQTGAPVYAAPAAFGDTIYVGSLDGMVHAVSVESGRPVWRTPVEGPVNAAAVVSGEVVYVGTLKKRILGLHRQDGRLVWSQETDGRIKTPPVAAHGRLLVATDEHTMICFVEGEK